ncbi:MAG: DinB family protein [Terriglobales bacterium]
MDHVIRATPRKIVTHVLMHEIRHWAQIATLLRLSGFAVEPQDYLFSPVMGESRRA